MTQEGSPEPGGFIREALGEPDRGVVASPVRTTAGAVPSKRPSEEALDAPSPAKRQKTSGDHDDDGGGGGPLPEPSTPPRHVVPLPLVDDPPSASPNGLVEAPAPAVSLPSPSPGDTDDPDGPSGRSSSPPSNGAANGRPSSPQSSPHSAGSGNSFDSLNGSSSKRVKLYRLNGEQWDDLGTGFCSIWAEPPPGVHVEEDEGPWLLVQAEVLEDEEAAAAAASSSTSSSPPAEDAKGEVIWKSGMRSVILHGNEDVERGGYQKQQQTLVVWTEPSGDDMALSFASASGCAEVWDYMEDIRRFFLQRGPASPAGSVTTPAISPQRAGQPEAFLQLFSNGSLPDPSLGNLLDISKLIKWASRTPLGREKLATLVIRSDFIRKLIPIMGEAEDLESLDDLHELCVIMQSLLLLNENPIFEYVLQDDVIFGVTSILEYDPEFPNMKASYTAHLSNPSHFREVVEIRDPAIKSKIHQIYRLQYLKDVILARILDDATFSMLNSFIYFHQVDIVTHLQQNVAFLSQLFGLFGVILGSAPSSSPPPPPAPAEEQRDGILFIQQFCAMAKNLQITSRNVFYRQMADRGLLRVIEHALRNPPVPESESLTGQDVRAAVVEILMTLVDHDPASVRAYSLRQGEADQPSFMEFVIELFLTEKDLGIMSQYAEAIRLLVQAQPEAGTIEAMQARGRPEDPDAEKFLQFFYDKCVGGLVQPLLELQDPALEPGGLLELSREQTALCAHLCDHLCYFVSAHSFRSKFFLLGSPVNLQITRLMRTTQKHLRLSALRYLRACLSKSDEFWNRNLVKNDLFLPILQLAEGELGHENLLSSACLDFFEFVRATNAKLILNHLMTNHADRVRGLAEKETVYQGLIRRWEQNNEPKPDQSTESVVNGRSDEPAEMPRIPAGLGTYAVNATKTLDAEEESYFEGSSDEEDDLAMASAAAAAAPVGSGSTAPPTGLKRAADAEPLRKRFKADHSAPEARSPAVIFQEMRVKGQLSPSQPSGLNSLSDYGDDDEDSMSTSVSDEPAATPAEAILPAPPPAEPPPKRKAEEEQDALGMLGSSGTRSPAITKPKSTQETSALKKSSGLKISFKPTLRPTK